MDLAKSLQHKAGTFQQSTLQCLGHKPYLGRTGCRQVRHTFSSSSVVLGRVPGHGSWPGPLPHQVHNERVLPISGAELSPAPIELFWQHWSEIQSLAHELQGKQSQFWDKLQFKFQLCYFYQCHCGWASSSPCTVGTSSVTRGHSQYQYFQRNK